MKIEKSSIERSESAETEHAKGDDGMGRGFLNAIARVTSLLMIGPVAPGAYERNTGKRKPAD